MESQACDNHAPYTLSLWRLLHLNMIVIVSNIHENVSTTMLLTVYLSRIFTPHVYMVFVNCCNFPTMICHAP